MNTSVVARLAIAPFAIVIVSACAHNAAEPAATTPTTASSPNGAPPGAAAPEMAPTPYSAEEIRAANKPGTTYRYKVESPGEPTTIKVLEFVGGTAEGGDLKARVLDESGKEKEPAKVEHVSWEELRRHAEFPRASLTVEPGGAIEVPAGKFDATVYAVKAPNGETTKFYFAKSYAGPPVLFFKERNGKRVMTSTLIERKSGG